jgi:hypothetical protein
MVEKRKLKRDELNWIQQSHILVVVAAFFVSLSALWLLPMTQRAFIAQRNVEMFMTVAFGPLGLPFFVVSRLQTLLSLSPLVITIALLPYGLLTGALLQYWLREGWLVRFVLGGFMLTNALMVFIPFVVLDRSVNPIWSGTHCELVVSATEKTRISMYDVGDDKAYIFVSRSDDRGRTWREVGNTLHDKWPLKAACTRQQPEQSTARVRLVGTTIMVTHNNGRSWNVWNSCPQICLEPRVEIIRVQFQDERSGQLELSLTAGRKLTLITFDGGLTWQPR